MIEPVTQIELAKALNSLPEGGTRDVFRRLAFELDVYKTNHDLKVKILSNLADKLMLLSKDLRKLV